MPCPFDRSGGSTKHSKVASLHTPYIVVGAMPALGAVIAVSAMVLVLDGERLICFTAPILLASLLFGRNFGLLFAAFSSLLFYGLSAESSDLSVQLPVFIGAGIAVSFALGGLLKEQRRWKQTIEALQESEARLSALVESAVAGIVTIDERGIITSANKSAEELFQYRKDELEGHNVNMLMPEPYQSNHDRYIANYVKTGERKIIGIGREVIGRRKDGALFPMDLSVSEVNLNGRRTFTGLVHDLSDRKAAEEERKAMLAKEREARGEAERANRVKDEFLATLSHELRTPLNSIIGWSQILLKSRALTADTAAGLQTIERNARMQAQLVDDLLNLSRILAGKLSLRLEPVRVRDLLKDSIAMVMPAAQARKLRLSTDFEAADLVVNGDKARLHQVFWNLLSNAVKFTPPGGLISIRVCRNGECAEVSVTDTGQGIAPQFLPYIFERFRQGKVSANSGGGLGLGLSIAKHLAEYHGGRVEAFSRGEGQGARFIVALPLLDMRAAAAVRPEARMNSSPNRASDIRGVKVLVVDDEPDAREIARQALEGEKAEVFVAASGRDAWGILNQSHPDVLLCDIGMPGEDGWEFIRRLRKVAGKDLAHIPAAAVTAFARKEDRERSLNAGYQMHLSKPIPPAELIEAVAMLRKFGRAA